MKLPIPFINRKKNNSGYYLALLLEDEKISSVILEEELGKIKIVGKHQEHLSTPLESLEQDALISIVDKTISRAEEVLPPNIETHKTVFGVKEKWVEAESKKINKEHLAKLKKVCDTLDLTPIGFMVISEAIANLIQSEEGAPLSAILVEMGKKTVHATLFRGGHISESASGHVEHSLPAAVDNLLKQFTAPVLPAKIILSHSSDSKNISQHFIRHEWSKSLPFLHVPQISVLPADFDAKAVAVGAANQMGFEILGIADTTLHELSPTHKTPEDLPEVPLTLPPSDIPKTGDNFGFVTDKDIANQPIQKHFAEKVVEHEKNSEILPDKQSDQSTEKISHTNENFNEITNSPEEDEVLESNTTRRKQKIGLASLISRIPRFAFPKTFKFPKFLKNKGSVIPLAILGIFLLLGIGITAFYFYNVKAEIVLSVKPKEVTQVEAISISTTSGNDFSEKIIAGKSVSIDIDGEITTDATGKKDTGNKSKGSVTIYNSAASKASLSSGTAIKSSNGLTFTLDKDVDLASASGDIFSGTKPGTAQVGVTAKDIGTESNLPSATKFSIGGNSSLAAKNDSAFSGGSKKILNVVSKKDIDKLRADLPATLEKKAEEELAGKKSADEIILPTLISNTIIDEKFDKDVDDEAKQIKLTATVSFIGISYSKSDLLDFEKSVLKDKYSEDISFAENAIINEIKDIKVNKDKGIDANLKITAGLLPKIDNLEVANKLKDKSSKEARQILSTLPQVTNSDIKYSPNIFFLSGIFPRLPKNILVTVKPE